MSGMDTEFCIGIMLWPILNYYMPHIRSVSFGFARNIDSGSYEARAPGLCPGRCPTTKAAVSRGAMLSVIT